MNRLRNSLRLLQYLSLDVVLGAVACGWMASLWLQVQMPPAWWLALPLAVWVMYTTDHLLDARRLGNQAQSGRHRFHVQYFTQISRAWAVGMVLGTLVLPWFLPLGMLVVALSVGVLAAGHFWLIRRVQGRVKPWLAKEAGVAMVYTSGVWGGPWALSPERFYLETWLVICQFFCLALFNLLLLARYEIPEDAATNSSSWARGLGRAASKWAILSLALIVTGLAIFFLVQAESHIQLQTQAVFLAMLVVLCWVSVEEGHFRENERYRWVADGVFLFPLLLLW